tara:strand:+ start:382 stop:714 length:333 start_codon:yes stop_codon:yes gene_type:complete
MAATWTITALKYNNDSDKGVVEVSWECSDKETVSGVDHEGRVVGSEEYVPNPSAAGYVAYDSLTNAKVRSWVKATLGSDEVTRVETKVATQITKSKTPPILNTTNTGLPW